mgnify:FL=1
MDPKNLISINKNIDNVSEAAFPYWWVFQGENLQASGQEGQMVVFFGNDMATFIKMGVDADRYIKKCNECC